MKVLVLSDSHGNIFNMIQAVEREAPRMVLFCIGRWVASSSPFVWPGLFFFHHVPSFVSSQAHAKEAKLFC